LVGRGDSAPSEERRESSGSRVGEVDGMDEVGKVGVRYTFEGEVRVRYTHLFGTTATGRSGDRVASDNLGAKVLLGTLYKNEACDQVQIRLKFQTSKALKNMDYKEFRVMNEYKIEI